MDRDELRRLIERLVREELARLQTEASEPSSRPCDFAHGRRAAEPRNLITAVEVEIAAKGDKRLVVANAIVTPLARDRAKELGVTLSTD